MYLNHGIEVSFLLHGKDQAMAFASKYMVHCPSYEQIGKDVFLRSADITIDVQSRLAETLHLQIPLDKTSVLGKGNEWKDE